MLGAIVTAIVGIVCIVLGFSNRKGNINSLHSYHRERVSEEDRLPFGKAVGLGTIIIGVALIVNGALTAAAILADISGGPDSSPRIKKETVQWTFKLRMPKKDSSA